MAWGRCPTDLEASAPLSRLPSPPYPGAEQAKSGPAMPPFPPQAARGAEISLLPGWDFPRKPETKSQTDLRQP